MNTQIKITVFFVLFLFVSNCFTNPFLSNDCNFTIHSDSKTCKESLSPSLFLLSAFSNNTPSSVQLLSKGQVISNGSTISFGGIATGLGAYKDLDIIVQNNKSDTLILSNIQTSPSGSFTVTQAPTTVAPFSQSTLRLRFLPVSSGSFTRTFSFDTSDSVLPAVSLNISGAGVTMGTIPDVYLKFNGNLNDSTTNARNANPSGTIAYTTNRHGTLGMAASTDGTASIRIPSMPTWTNSTVFSSAFWINQATPTCDYFERRAGTVGAMEFALYTGGGTISNGFGRFSISWDTFYTFAFAPSINTWTHIAYVRHNSTSASVYINGSFVSTQTASTPASPVQSTDIAIFNNGFIGRCNGKIDDFMIWPIAFTPAQVAAIFNQN